MSTFYYYYLCIGDTLYPVSWDTSALKRLKACDYFALSALISLEAGAFQRASINIAIDHCQLAFDMITLTRHHHMFTFLYLSL